MNSWRAFKVTRMWQYWILMGMAYELDWMKPNKGLDEAVKEYLKPGGSGLWIHFEPVFKKNQKTMRWSTQAENVDLWTDVTDLFDVLKTTGINLEQYEGDH